jgi:uncharacterized protein (DUF362 family)
MPVGARNHPVLVTHLHAGDEGQQTKDLMEEAGLGGSLGRGDQVFLKPNLTYPRFEAGVTTRASFVEAVAIYFLERGCRVTIGEGPGGYNGFSMKAAFKAHGITEMGRRLGGEVVDLSDWETEPLQVTTKRGSTVTVPVARRLRHEFAALISLPVPKVHCMTGISLGMKNLWGTIPDTFRIRYHPYFDEIINALVGALPLAGVVLDGYYGLDVNGPMVDGICRRLNWIAASLDCPAHDVAVTSLLGFDPLRISHLRYGMELGVVRRPEAVHCIARDIKPQRFKLRPNLWNRLAAMTWLHPRLTWLVYLSPAAGPIHWFMYLFRRKPDDMTVRGLRGWE